MTWPPRRTPQRSDRGETLIELVVAVAILGIAAVAILAGLMLSVRTSDIHRNDATGGAYVRSFAEAIQTDVDANGYKPCATAASTYADVPVPDLPAGYTPSVTAVQSWNGSSWVRRATRRRRAAAGPQGDDHRDAPLAAEEKLTVVLRQPCNGSAAAAGANPCS